MELHLRVLGETRGPKGRRAVRAAAFEEDARLARLSGCRRAAAAARPAVRDVLGDSRRSARGAALEPEQAARPGRRDRACHAFSRPRHRGVRFAGGVDIDLVRDPRTRWLTGIEAYATDRLARPGGSIPRRVSGRARTFRPATTSRPGAAPSARTHASRGCASSIRWSRGLPTSPTLRCPMPVAQVRLDVSNEAARARLISLLGKTRTPRRGGAPARARPPAARRSWASPQTGELDRAVRASRSSGVADIRRDQRCAVFAVGERGDAAAGRPGGRARTPERRIR